MILNDNLTLENDFQEFNLDVDNLNYAVPCVFLKAKNKNAKKVVIYIHGLNGTKNSLQFLSSHLDNAHIISFDARSCGSNENPATVHYFKYADDLKEIILLLKSKLRKYNIEEFYLIGESFGASVSILFYSKFQDYIDGILIWNMPRKVIDVSKSTLKDKIKMAFPLVWSLATNLPTYDYAPSPLEKLSNNKIMIRVSKLKKDTKKSDNRSILAAWLGNYKAWRIILSKNFIKRNKINLVYISSSEDLLQDKEAVMELNKKIAKEKFKHFIAFNSDYGHHILLYDVPMGNFLIDAINKFIEIPKENNLDSFKEDLILLNEKYVKEIE